MDVHPKIAQDCTALGWVLGRWSSFGEGIASFSVIRGGYPPSVTRLCQMRTELRLIEGLGLVVGICVGVGDEVGLGFAEFKGGWNQTAGAGRLLSHIC